MRAILLVLILVVVALIVAVATGLINLNMTRGPQVPTLSATGNGVTAKGGQTPAFDIETGSVKVGTKEATVEVPTLSVDRAGNTSAPARADSKEQPANASGM